jgi:hypothetical protein
VRAERLASAGARVADDLDEYNGMVVDGRYGFYVPSGFRTCQLLRGRP